MSTTASANDLNIYGFETGPADDTLLYSSQEERRRELWQQLIDRRLVEWGRDPVEVDEDVNPPTRTALRRAIKAAEAWQDDGVILPDWVVGTGDGGIAFRWGQQGEYLLSFDFRGDGSIYQTESKHSRTISRTRLA